MPCQTNKRQNEYYCGDRKFESNSFDPVHEMNKG